MSLTEDRRPVRPQFSLKDMQEAMSMQALKGRFLSPFYSFLRYMKLEWGDSPGSAYSYMRGNQRVIVDCLEFFATHVLDASEGGHINWHEAFHHLFWHLLRDTEALRQEGYNAAVRNVADDAVINAYLSKMNCAGFMQRFYPDEDYLAFLRPGSEEFRISRLNPDGTLSEEKFPAFEVDPELAWEFKQFYAKLYRLDVTRKEACAFFQRHFPLSEEAMPLVCGHGHGPGKDTSHGSMFGSDEANAIMRALEIKEVCQTAKDNFRQVIDEVTSIILQPGDVRTGTRKTRKVPTRLKNRDLINIERGKFQFDQSEYQSRKAWIFLDVSGSVEAYVPFILGLITSLGEAELVVNACCWAERIEEVSWDNLKDGKLPEVGVGTYGEVVAQFIEEKEISQSVIITDNWAGPIETKITTPVHLCLMEGSSEGGSFLDSDAVPNCTVHHLRLSGGN